MKWDSMFDENTNLRKYTNKKELLAIGLSAWAMCMVGNEPPKTFGEVMVHIGSTLGISASPDSLNKYADKVISGEVKI